MSFERTYEQLQEFVLINHHFMLIKEMAEETGYTHQQIWAICNRLNLKPISELDRKKEYIQSHSHLSATEIAENLACHVTYVRDLAVELGVQLKRPGATNIKSDNFIRNLTESDKDDLFRITGNDLFRKKQKSKRPPIKDAYTQSGSNLLDELRGIKTTERIK